MAAQDIQGVPLCTVPFNAKHAYYVPWDYFFAEWVLYDLSSTIQCDQNNNCYNNEFVKT